VRLRDYGAELCAVAQNLTAFGSPPIGPLDAPLEGNLPSFCPETAGLEQLLQVTLTPTFLVRQGINQKNQCDAL
jgi:hypothetical protein